VQPEQVRSTVSVTCPGKVPAPLYVLVRQAENSDVSALESVAVAVIADPAATVTGKPRLRNCCHHLGLEFRVEVHGPTVSSTGAFPSSVGRLGPPIGGDRCGWPPVHARRSL
jgi:hypothetical protein